MLVRGDSLIPLEQPFVQGLPGEEPVVQVPHAVAGLQPLHRRHPLRRRHRSQDHRRDGVVSPFRAREPRDRSRSGWIDGVEEARRLFLMPLLTAIIPTPWKIRFQWRIFSLRNEAKICCASPPRAAWMTASPR